MCAYGLPTTWEKLRLRLARGSRACGTRGGRYPPWPSISAARPLKMCISLASRPQATQALLKSLIRQVYAAATYEEGLKRGRARIARWRTRSPGMPRFPTETAGLKLVVATVLTAAQLWRGSRMTPRLLRELDARRREHSPVQS